MNSFVLLFLVILILASSSFTEAIKKRFIFRLDDVQDFYYSAAQQQILTWLMDNGYGVSAGIIGDYWNAQDAALFSVLQRCVSMSKDKCALFNHGSDAQYTFADASSVAEAQDQIKACDDKIKTYFPGYQVELFVPHQNSWGGYLLQALRNLGYSAVSASTLDYSNLPQSLTSNPIQLSQQTETGEYNSGGSWSAWPIDTAVAECEAAMTRGDAACVIMMHPFEFGDGAYTFAMLQQLINRLTGLGYTSTNFHSIIQEVKGGVAPTGVSTPAPSFRPTAKPNAVTVAPTIATTRAPTIIQSSAPSYVPGSVSTAWGQCGGQTYTGPTNCPDGYTCTFGSIWYSQCKPCNGNCPQTNSNTPTMATTRAPTNAVVPTQTRVPTFKPTFSATTSLPKKRFIFRLDDVQDFSYSSAQQQILTWLMDRGYGVAAGIIGDLWNGADAALLSVLRRCVNLGKDKCALFNHGRNAEYIFATAPSVAEAQAQVQACDTKIKTVFPGYEIDLFVPHQNSWSNNLLQALRNMGYPAVSASTLDYSNLPQSLTTTPIQLSQQSETGRYNPGGYWTAWPVDNAVADCEAAMARGDAVCVIMMHPFEFGDGTYTFTMLQQLVDRLTGLGYTSTNFHTIIQEVKGGVQSTNAPTVLSTPAPSIRPTENPTRTAAPSALTTTSSSPTTRPTENPTRTAAPSALTTTSSSPTTRPTENPTRTAAPSALITARPSNSPNSVSTAWGQCGGAVYTGPTNCPAGFTCVYGGFWYSQCNPCSGSCPTPSSSSTPAPTSPPGTVSAPWGQCAGIGYSGPSNCPNGFSCVYGSDWYSQCKPATTNSARASLDYQITVPVENVQGTSFSRASEAALMIAIRIIQEETGHHVDSLEVKANKVQANNPTNQLRFSSKVSDIHKEALVSTSFSLTLSMSIYMEDKDSAKTVYADSTTALTTAAKSGMLQTLFRNFAIQFNAVESSNAVITAVSSSKYSYDTPSSSSSSSNSSASSTNIFMIVLPIGLCLLLFVSLSYFIIRYYRQRMEKDRLSKQSDAFLITEKYVSADYTIASSERQSMDFVEDNFLHLHGIDCDVNVPKREEEAPIEVAAFTETEVPTAVEYANV